MEEDVCHLYNVLMILGFPLPQTFFFNFNEKTNDFSKIWDSKIKKKRFLSVNIFRIPSINTKVEVWSSRKCLSKYLKIVLNYSTKTMYLDTLYSVTIATVIYVKKKLF